MSRRTFWADAGPGLVGASVVVALPLGVAPGIAGLIACPIQVRPAAARMRNAGRPPARLAIPGRPIIVAGLATRGTAPPADPFADRPATAAGALSGWLVPMLNGAERLALAVLTPSVLLLVWWLTWPARAG